MNDNYIEIPLSLGLRIYKLLNIKPRYNKIGLPSFTFTTEELSKITNLNIENPVSGDLQGIEYLPNLTSLKVQSYGRNYYKQDKEITSISKADIKAISKCTNLTSLEIINQERISFIDLDKLQKLKHLVITRNNQLEEVFGLESLNNLKYFHFSGNDLISQIKGLDKIILNNSNMEYLLLDLLLFPDAAGYTIKDMSLNPDLVKKLSSMHIVWEEKFGNFDQDNIMINTSRMLEMHKKACEALMEYVPQYCEKKTAIAGAELFLSQNVEYDSEGLKNDFSQHVVNGELVGPIGGTNGAYNAFMYNSCVCEGYTRAMQYLLRLKGINTRNIHCIAREDNLKMAFDKDNNKHRKYLIPDGDRHSIIAIDDDNYWFYDDPCWNANDYQAGIKTMTWVLLDKNDISKDHTLCFTEKNVSDNRVTISRERVKLEFDRIELYHQSRKKQQMSEVKSSDNPMNL